MPDSIIKCIKAVTTKKNMDMGIEFFNCDLQPFKVDADVGEI